MQKMEKSGLFVHVVEHALGLFVYTYTEGIGDCCSYQAWLNSYPKPSKTIFWTDVLSAIEKASVEKPFIGFECAFLWDLKHGLDDVLRVRKYPAVDAGKCTDQHSLQKGQTFVLLCQYFLFQELVRCELGRIRTNLSKSSWVCAPKEASNALFFEDFFCAGWGRGVFWIFIELHPTLDQLDRRNYNRVDESRKRSILNPVDEAKFSLFGHFLIEFVSGEDDGVDEGYGDERIVDSVEKMHESLFLEDVFEGCGHGEGVIHLHANFQRVEDVARDAVAHSWESAAEHVS